MVARLAEMVAVVVALAAAAVEVAVGMSRAILLGVRKGQLVRADCSNVGGMTSDSVTALPTEESSTGRERARTKDA